MEELSTADKVMADVVASLAALTEHAMENVLQPPRGSIQEVGHYRQLNKSLKRKDLDALQSLLDEVAYNVAASIFATMDGSVESDFPDFPELALVDKRSNEVIADSLYDAFRRVWEDEELPHPD